MRKTARGASRLRSANGRIQSVFLQSIEAHSMLHPFHREVLESGARGGVARRPGERQKRKDGLGDVCTHHFAGLGWSSGQPSGGLARRRRVRPSGRFSFSAAFSCRLVLLPQAFQTWAVPSRAGMSPALWRERNAHTVIGWGVAAHLYARCHI